MVPLSRHPLTADAVKLLLERWRERARSVYPVDSPELRGVEQILNLGSTHPELFVALGALAEQITYDEMLV